MKVGSCEQSFWPLTVELEVCGSSRVWICVNMILLTERKIKLQDKSDFVKQCIAYTVANGQAVSYSRA